MVDYGKKYQHLKVEISAEGVALVTLNRPPHNLINIKMHTELAEIPRELNDDDDVRAVVLAANGKNFASGGDYELFERYKDQPLKKAISRKEARDFIWNMIDLEKPAVAAVHGLATGMGCQMALLCDIVLAADDEKTRFSDGHMNIGVPPGDGGALIFPLLIGLGRAKQYLYTADPIYAKEAERIGLINKVVPPDQLLPAAMEWGTRLANLPTSAIRWAKAALNQWLRVGAVNIFNYSWGLQMYAMDKPDNLEALAAMKEKRPPRFRDLK